MWALPPHIWGVTSPYIAWVFEFGNGRGGEIRTHDPLYPKQVRYQTAPRPGPCALIRRSHEGDKSKFKVSDKDLQHSRQMTDAAAYRRP